MFKRWFVKKNLLLLAGGALIGEGIRSLSRNKSVRDAAVKTLAKGMVAGDKVKQSVTRFKEDAVDLFEEAKREGNEIEAEGPVVETE